MQRSEPVVVGGRVGRGAVLEEQGRSLRPAAVRCEVQRRLAVEVS